jgi:hypothetical protein
MYKVNINSNNIHKYSKLEKYIKLKGQSIVIKMTSHRNQVLNVIKLTITSNSSSKITQNDIPSEKDIKFKK